MCFQMRHRLRRTCISSGIGMDLSSTGNFWCIAQYFEAKFCTVSTDPSNVAAEPCWYVVRCGLNTRIDNCTSFQFETTYHLPEKTVNISEFCSKCCLC